MHKTPPAIVRWLLKAKRVATMLDCSLRHVYDLADRGELEFVRDGRAAYVVAESLDADVSKLRQRAAAARAKDKQEPSHAGRL